MTTKSSDKIKSERIFVAAENLSVVWAQSQRPFNEAWADKIAEEFDPDKFDDPVITQPNGAGHYHVVEGQHRVKGAEKAFGSKVMIGCRMVNAEDPARAAEIWLGINSGRKAIRPIQKFMVSVTAEREPETEINAMINKMNYRISPSKGDYCIGAVSALISVHKKFGKSVLHSTLVLLHHTWPGDSSAFGGDLIRGYAEFINEFRTMDARRMAEVIKREFSPNQLLMAGRSYVETRKISLSEGIGAALFSRYNKGLRDGLKLKRKA